MPFGRPFRAISLCVSFPGLKPWAVFCSPVGRLELAQENVQTPGPKGPKEFSPAHGFTPGTNQAVKSDKA
jgi:hypothetical protein